MLWLYQDAPRRKAPTARKGPMMIGQHDTAALGLSGKRAGRWRIAASGAILTLAGFALVVMAGVARPASARSVAGGESQVARGPVDRAAVVAQYLAAISRGDVDAAIAMFADNAVFIGGRPTGNCSQQTPCATAAGIRQQLEGAVGVHVCQTLVEVQVVGAVVSGRIEVRADDLRVIGIERGVASFIALVPQDKITFFALVSDSADAQIARRDAILSGREAAGAPLPNPATPCADVQQN